MHAIQWFEIPAQDLDRAYAFYHDVLGGNVRKGTFGDGELILFNVPFGTGEAVGGSIVQRSDLQPGMSGALVYINAFGRLEDAVSRVEAAGGKVFASSIDLGKFGYAAIIGDTEGNKIGLISHEP